MHALVTGSAGFVGRHLLPRLGAAGFEVVGTDQELDVADASAVASKVAELRPEAIVHLAALSSVAESWRRPELAYRVNYLGARSVLEAAARAAPEARVLLVGSAEEYGSAEPGSLPFTEAAPLRPRFRLRRLPIHNLTSLSQLEKMVSSPLNALVHRLYAFVHLAIRNTVGHGVETKIRLLLTKLGLDKPESLFKLAVGLGAGAAVLYLLIRFAGW